MDVMQVLAAHGGALGGGKYRKGGKIPATNLIPPIVPTLVSDFALYVQTSSTLSMSYDPFEDLIIATHYSSTSQSRILRCKPNDMKAINSVYISSDNSGNNPSNKLSHCNVYANGKYYTTFSVYPTSQSSIRVHDAATGSLIKTINGTGIDLILQRTADYVIYFCSYHKKIHKLNFADDSVNVITDLNSYSNPSALVVHGWDKFIIKDNGKSYLYNYDGTYSGTVINNQNIIQPAFYHPPSNTIICMRYKYATTGGHFMEKYDPTNFALISSKKLTDRNQVSSSGWGPNCYYDVGSKAVLVTMTDYNTPITYLFPIADDGITIVGWDYAQLPGTNLGKYGGVKSGSFEVVTRDGIASRIYVDPGSTDYTHEVLHMRTNFLIGG
ncbi:hypothetical protein [Brevibacillus aydinogluensis]|uniref:hypothetical protein n=1 Tax=Brevibacillus aydinogluensis TaxID=927786 RepID=UPI0026F3BCE3|nr:hypothetical protein [Brevibacillus aydinogluensis]